MNDGTGARNTKGPKRITGATKTKPSSSSFGTTICAISSGAGMGWMGHVQPIMELIATPGVDEGQEWCKAHPDLVDQGYAFSKEAIIVWVMAASTPLR